MSPFKIEHEYDDQGMHRLKAYNGEKWEFGSWCSYRVPATIEFDNRTFITFTEYWQGYFKAEVIFELTELVD